MDPDQSEDENKAQEKPPVGFHPPSADLFLQPRFCPAANGWHWVKDSFSLFKVNWLIWIVMILIWFVITVAPNAIPVVNIIASLFAPVFTGGMMLGARAQDTGEALRVTHLFDGFKQQLRALFNVGVLYSLGFFLAAMLTAMFLILFLGEANVQQMLQNIEQEVSPDAATVSAALLLGPLLLLALVIPLMMGLWFAPALVVFHKMPAYAAMKLSFSGCLANMIPFLIYGLVMLVLMMIAAIPFFLGFVILFPVIFISQYVSYKDIFLHADVAA